MNFEGGSLLDGSIPDIDDEWSFSDDKSENYHDVSSSNRSISNSSLKIWHHQFLKIDFKVVNMQPNNRKLISEVQKNTLFLRFITLELCLALNYANTQYDIIIPLNQVQNFYLTQNREIHLELKVDFTRYYYHNPKGSFATRFSISMDPTNGKFEGANRFIFTPSEWVDINTLMFFEEGVKQLIKHQIQNQLKLCEPNIQVSEINSLVYIGDEKDQIKSFQNNIHGDDKDTVQMTCFFLNKKHSLRVSKESTFKDILTTIQDRYQVSINPNLVSYKNQVNDMISLIDEEDWNAAKWEIEMAKVGKIDLYFY